MQPRMPSLTPPSPGAEHRSRVRTGAPAVCVHSDHHVNASLGLRRPATSVIAECLRVQATIPKNTAVQRFFGVSPLGREAQPWYVGALGELEVAGGSGRSGRGGTCCTRVPVGTGASDAPTTS